MRRARAEVIAQPARADREATQGATRGRGPPRRRTVQRAHVEAGVDVGQLEHRLRRARESTAGIVRWRAVAEPGARATGSSARTAHASRVRCAHSAATDRPSVGHEQRSRRRPRSRSPRRGADLLVVGREVRDVAGVWCSRSGGRLRRSARRTRLRARSVLGSAAGRSSRPPVHAAPGGRSPSRSGGWWHEGRDDLALVVVGEGGTGSRVRARRRATRASGRHRVLPPQTVRTILPNCSPRAASRSKAARASVAGRSSRSRGVRRCARREGEQRAQVLGRAHGRAEHRAGSWKNTRWMPRRSGVARGRADRSSRPRAPRRPSGTTWPCRPTRARGQRAAASARLVGRSRTARTGARSRRSSGRLVTCTSGLQPPEDDRAVATPPPRPGQGRIARLGPARAEDRPVGREPCAVTKRNPLPRKPRACRRGSRAGLRRARRGSG